MINAAKEIVFAAGSRQRCTELGIGQGPANRDDAANHPQHDQREPGLQRHQLKAETGEHTGSDHVGNDDGQGCHRGEIGFHQTWISGTARRLSMLIYRYSSVRYGPAIW